MFRYIFRKKNISADLLRHH